MYLAVQTIQQYFGSTGSFRLNDSSAIVSETFLRRKVTDLLTKRWSVCIPVCDLLGISFNRPVNARISLDVFQLRGRRNPDGWGVAFYRDGLLQVIKEAAPATDSRLYNFTEGSTRSKIFISHVRRTTRGVRSYLNTHPFYRQTQLGGARQEWAFAHNGTLETVHKLRIGQFQPLGNTDSERAFCYILERVSGLGNTEWNDDSFAFMRDLFREINNRTNSLNCMLSDGDLLFCYSDENRHNDGLRYVKRQAPFGSVRLVREDERMGLVEIRQVNLDEKKASDETGYMIVTQELTDEKWREFSEGELIVFRDGEMSYRSGR